jgi:hypothetical protein
VVSIFRKNGHHQHDLAAGGGALQQRARARIRNKIRIDSQNTGRVRRLEMGVSAWVELNWKSVLFLGGRGWGLGGGEGCL